ncbi:DUF2383 domain-containing protein [Hasllibacter sp. MH4015]|uniref:DUF2383 domain-containing protein n=1 Tax=Hasllibacter sp. MH4015 TaxID=2854029 RepID=UPI001CD70D42|nr:DUF2383 domain-containing protein [Hasllibacter sp. MH4015]
MATPAAPYPPVQPIEADETRADIDAIQKALTRTCDALAGYDKMVEEAEAEVLPILRKIHEIHRVHAGQLASLINGMGGTPDTDGSVMTTVNKTVISLRALFDEIDDDALERAIDGEEYVTDAFHDAMAEVPEGPDRQALADMLAELEAVLDEARAIAD